MGARGPLPVPDNLRLLRGKAPSKAPATVAKRIPPGRPSAPPWLDAEALAEWKRVVPDLDKLGVLAKVDRATVANYCTAVSIAMQAQAHLAADGLIRAPRADNPPGKSPAWQVFREAATLAAALAKELLLTPNARLRATMPEAKDAEEGEGILD